MEKVMQTMKALEFKTKYLHFMGLLMKRRSQDYCHIKNRALFLYVIANNSLYIYIDLY